MCCSLRSWIPAALIGLLTALPASGQVPAFPGAEGFGAMAKGGRGGRVVFVTNLNDSGPGSFREAVTATGPRLVIFRVAGVIDLRSTVTIRQPFLTIAGQTAPGDGVCLRGYGLNIVTQDVIVRHLRVRPGDIARAENDGISVSNGSRRVILDHCSVSWATDETLSPSGDIADVTVQWCIISESLHNSVHSKGPHGYGSLVRATGGVTMHHNLWAHHNGRSPRPGDNYGAPPWPTLDIRNNVMYNYGSYCTGTVDGTINVNYVGNFIKPGFNSRLSRAPISVSSTNTGLTRFYIADNIMEQRDDLTHDNARMFDRVATAAGAPLITLVDKPFDAPAVVTTHANDAYMSVFARAGATVPVRDPVDARLILHMRCSLGRIIDSQEDVGGYPLYRTGIVPQDTDNDGMPDSWEIARGLNPLDPADGAQLHSTGYTHLEMYLNELAVPAPAEPVPLVCPE